MLFCNFWARLLKIFVFNSIPEVSVLILTKKTDQISVRLVIGLLIVQKFDYKKPLGINIFFKNRPLEQPNF